MSILGVQVFGQRELEARIARGGLVMSHLVSIVDPRPSLARPAEDEATPAAVASAFRRALRLRFSDQLEAEATGRGRRAPSIRDARRVIRFVERSMGKADGYTVHCWSGVSRSAAVAFGILYLLRGCEEEAARELMRIRPVARPHPELLAHFDALLGSKLADATAVLLEERLKVMRERIREAAAKAKGPSQSSADSSSSR